MTSKADRLIELSENGFQKYILPIVVIRRNQVNCQNKLLEISNLHANAYVIRSSAVDEDQNFSNAGKYLSILNVGLEDVFSSVAKVFASFENPDAGDQVFVQPYLENVTRSGVIFTRDPNSGAKYFVINSTNGRDTTAVTSGAENGSLEIILNSHFEEFDSPVIENNRELIELIQSVSTFYHDIPLDIEFGQTEDSLVLFQVRPLNVTTSRLSDFLLKENLNQIANLVNENQNRNPFLLGETSYFGIMPDWNPAELIGVKPTRLASSLFKELITDSIWAYERGNLGYRNVRSFPLLIEFAGQPYIDVRASFNSLVPGNLDDSIAEKLVNFYLEELRKNPHFHDKIESEVILSSYTFDLDKKLQKLPNSFSAFEKEEISREVKSLTRSIITGERYGLKQILAKCEPLDERFELALNSDLNLISKIYWLLEDCKRHGTLPFAGAARLAFIATNLMNSFIETEVLKIEEVQDFFQSIRTITSQLISDRVNLDESDFIDKYGHLRPGTYDIRIPSYKQNFNTYFGNILASPSSNQTIEFDPTKLSEKIVDSGLLTHLGISVSELFIFVSESIMAREEIKFRYSKNISVILDLIAEYALENGFSVEESAHFKIGSFLNSYRESTNLNFQLKSDVALGIESYAATQAVWLPPIIFEANDVFAFEIPPTHPNFITHKSVHGKIVPLNHVSVDLEGKILLIESADPGYDWIFTKGILGFITCYGGANSHMAVRAKELDIPAAIGIGSQVYELLAQAPFVYLDCMNKRIEF
jgi:phosphohistidine swiveling domain-containing protein